MIQMEPNNYDQAVVRSDQTLSDKHSLFERYIYYTAAESVPSVQTATSFPQRGQNVSIGDTYLVSSSLVNEVRIGYNRAYGITNQVNPVPGKNWVALAGLQNVGAGVTPSEYSRPTVNITGFTVLGENGVFQGDTENIYSVGDTVSDVIGRHTLRVGAQFQYRQITQLADVPAAGNFVFGPTTTPTGVVIATSLQNYMSGLCTICQAGTGNSLGHYTDNTYGVFMNDVWQVGHGLTVNYGIRWEYVSPFVEKNGLAGSFDPGSQQIAFHKVPSNIPPVLLPNVNLTPNFFPAGIAQPFKKGFGPRVGLAYQAAPRTVVRAGYGIYYENTNTNELQFQRDLPPFYFNATLNNQNVQQMIPPLNQLPSIPAPFSLSAKNLVPYTQEWTASVQQDLGHQVLFELSYTGSATHRLWKRYDQNEDSIVTIGGLSTTRPYPHFLHGMLTSYNVGNANFEGLSAKLEQRYNSGLYYLVNYQFSKNLDNNSGEADSNDTSYSTHFNFDHSYSNYDVRNRAVGSLGYELPFGTGKRYLQTGIGRTIAGGWQIQPIVQLRTGFPFSITGGSGSCACGTYVPQRVNLAPGRASGKIAHPGPFHWFDATAYATPVVNTVTGVGPQGLVTRNTLRGPGTAEVDFSAIKNFVIFEHLSGQFRAEAFNIINHPNFGNPANNIAATNVGQISSTSADNRDIQFAMKLLW